MQNRPPPPGNAKHPNLFAPSGNKKGKARQAPTSMTDASRAHPAPPTRPQPPPPPPPLPLASMTASSASGSGPPLAHSPQSHRPPSNHQAGGPPLPGQARPLSSLAAPEIRKQVTSAMKRLAIIARDQQDRDYLESAYDWPDLAEEERNALNAKLDLARQAEMAQRDKTIEMEYSKLSNDMIALFTGLVEHATSSRLEGLVRRCDAQQKRIDDLEAQQRGASSTTTTTATGGDSSAAAATVAAAQQKRIDDLERKLNTLVQAQAQAQQTPTSSSSPRPTGAPGGRPQAFSPTAGAGNSASPPGTPFDPASAPTDLNATYKELRDKYRNLGHEVVSQRARIEKLNANVGEVQKKLAGQLQSEEGIGGEVVKGWEKRLEKVEQALMVTPQQQQQQSGAGAATSTGGGGGGGGTVDPRRRPSSTTPAADAQAPPAANAAVAAAAAEVATLRTDFDAFAARVSSQLGKRPHDGVDGADSGADHPHKAPKSTEGATPASATAKAGNDDDDDDNQQQQLEARLQKVEERLEGCEQKVTALRGDVDKGASRIEATGVNVADLEKKDKERTEREQTAAAAAAPPVWKGGSSTSDMDLDKSDEEDQKAKANAEKFDVLERRIQQMEASESPELLIEPVKNEVAELRKLLDEHVPSADAADHPKQILALVRDLETAVAKSSEFATPVLEALRSFVGTAADGSALPADQVRSKLLDTLVRMRDDLQRHGTTLASHDQSIKSLVEANEGTDSKFESLEDLGIFLGEALPQLRDLYLLVCRAQEMNLFPKTATLFPNANASANSNANRLASTNGSLGSSTPAASTTTAAAANAAPNGIVTGASSTSGANPAPQPNGIVGAPPPPTTTAASTNTGSSSSTATTGANAPAQRPPSATSTNPSSLPQRPQQPHGQQQRPGSANGSSSGATPRMIPNSLPPRPQ